MKAYDISLIAATLNEIGNIENFINEVEKYLSSYSYEIIIIDDNSSDGTKEYLSKRSDDDDHLHVIENPKRYGMLRSLMIGITQATGRIRLIMDADMQHPPALIPVLISQIQNGYDVAIASRYIKGGSPGDRTGFRGLLSRGAEYIAYVLVKSSRKTTDPMSGFFAYSDKMKMDFNYKNFFPQADFGAKILLILLAENQKAKVIDVPYVFLSRKRGKSKIVNGRSFVIRYTAELINIIRLDHSNRKAETK
ncbi:MAG: glycosyltransferase, partial [Thermoplasmata archaeon]